MSDISDLDLRRFINKNIERSSKVMPEMAEDFYGKIYGLCEEFRNKTHEDHLQINRQLKGQTAEILVLGALLRFTANWSTRISDNLSKEEDWHISPEQSKQLILDLFSQLFDQELELELEFTQTMAKKFIETLRKSKLVKVKSEKSEIFKKEIQDADSTKT